jgi:hypothetical protein
VTIARSRTLDALATDTPQHEHEHEHEHECAEHDDVCDDECCIAAAVLSAEGWE